MLLTRSTWIVLSSLALGAAACGLDSTADSAGDGFGGGDGFGATPGGVKDMELARELLDNGQIPPPGAILVEGMFSEHDLGLAGEPCKRTLCLRAAAGIAPDAEGTPAGWVQLGLSSTVDPETWARPSTTFVMTVDVSGSMGWEYQDGEYPSAGQLSRELLRGLAEELTRRDRVAIVTYGDDVGEPLRLTAGDDPAFDAVVEGLSTDGSTNMEAGLVRAYRIAREAIQDGETDEVRILLFTDVQPNVGLTEASDFERMVSDGADDGIGITVLAVGLGIGPEVLASMAHLRGGNAFSFFRQSDVEAFMAEDWPWFTSPIAHDLSLEVTPRADLQVGEKYGFPGGEQPGLEVSSVFLSRRKGALLFSLEGDDLSAMGADIALSYIDADGERVNEQLTAAHGGEPLDERGHHFDQEATARATSLALLVSGMRRAAELYAESPDQAETIMSRTDERFAADAAAIADPTLDVELEMSARMLALISERAEQGTLYGQ